MNNSENKKKLRETIKIIRLRKRRKIKINQIKIKIATIERVVGVQMSAYLRHNSEPIS